MKKGQKGTKVFRAKMSAIGVERQKMLWGIPSYRAMMVASHIGKKQSQETIQKRVRHLIGHKTSITTRKKIGDANRGERNGNWKGENVGYMGLHNWIRKILGTPKTCENCGKTGLTKSKIDWANKSREYKREISDWIRLCRSCHILYDKNKLI